MKKMLLIVGTVFWTFAAAAAPVTYVGSSFQTDAVALTTSQSDAQSASSPPTALPLVASATVFGATDFASGSGIAAAGLLTGQSEASSATGFASAAGTAGFVGTFFANASSTSLHFVVDSLNFTDPAAFSSGTLFVLLTSGATTYLNQTIASSGVFDYLVHAPLGAALMLNLFVDSEASVSSGGNAANFVSATFQVADVPEPPTAALLVIALIGFATFGRRWSEGTRPFDERGPRPSAHESCRQKPVSAMTQSETT